MVHAEWTNEFSIFCKSIETDCECNINMNFKQFEYQPHFMLYAHHFYLFGFNLKLTSSYVDLTI